jgi:ribosomal protein L11 methyltransferase
MEETAMSAPNPAVTPSAEAGGAGSPGGRQPAADDHVTLVFYPPEGSEASEVEIRAALPQALQAPDRAQIEARDVPRDWVDGWKEHFRPIVIGEVRIRPPWEEPADPEGPLVDVVINPGLGFGTGLHPTTRGTLELLQEPTSADGSTTYFLGPVVDAGTGSGILAIAAAKLGWGPIFAFDNDPVALVSARENVEANGVAGIVEIQQSDIDGASSYWFSGATVLANMTLDPALTLIRRLARLQDGRSDAFSSRPVERLVVSGILAGGQERQLLGEARLAGFSAGRKVYEAEWVSLEFLPPKRTAPTDTLWG